MCLKKVTRVLEDGDDSYEFVQARIDTINDELFTYYKMLLIIKKLNLYWFVLMKMFVNSIRHH
jgi:hypothetical protein